MRFLSADGGLWFIPSLFLKWIWKNDTNELEYSYNEKFIDAVFFCIFVYHGDSIEVTLAPKY